MKTYLIAIVSAALLVLTHAGCGSDNPIPAHLKNTWGIEISGLTGDFAVDEGGTQIHSSTGRIAVDGLGSNQIRATTIVAPMAMGGETTLMVANLDGSDERYFLYDPVQNYITIGDYTKGAAVAKNPDGTYAVWAFDGTHNRDQELRVPDGFEALKLVEQYNTFKTISPYILLSAIAFAHASAPEARGSLIVQSNTAAAPVVCDIFKEFCDCAACLVLKRQGSCALCPKL